MGYLLQEALRFMVAILYCGTSDDAVFYLRKRAYFFRAAEVSGIPPIASIFASNSSVRGKTLSIGIRTGLTLPERFEIVMGVRFDVVDGMMK